ncbi:hypothetical protein M9458_013552, partial [Cirrhinus mrigala]
SSSASLSATVPSVAGPPPLHGHGPPSHPLFCLCSPTFLDCCCFERQESLLEGGIL